MRRPTLLAWVAAGSAALVLATAAGLAGAAEQLLQRLADEQALARAALAARTARHAIEQRGDELTATASLLAERPSLHRLLGASRDRSELAAFLAGYAEQSGAPCAVWDGARWIDPRPGTLPWDELRRGALPAGRAALLALDDGALVLAAATPLAEPVGAQALVAERLDARHLAALASEVGTALHLTTRHDALAAYGTPRAALLARVIGEGARGALRAEETASYCALEPLRLASGAVGAVLEARLPTAPIDASVTRLRRSLLAAAAGLALLAVPLSMAAARRLTRPLANLTAASQRIGSGDLASAVPAQGFAEVGVLAGAMEEMRQRLLRLTGELAHREQESAAVLAGISEGVLSVDRDRRVRFVNGQAAALLGVAPQDAVGRFCGDLLHPAASPDERPCEERCPILHARFAGPARATETLALAGRRPTALVTAAAPAGDLQVVLLREETEAEAGRRLRETLLANLSHEFKTPLAAQQAALEMLRERLAQGELAESDLLLEALERGTLRLARLIDNLLESGRIEAGRDDIRRRPVALDPVVEEATEATAPLLAQRRQELRLELPHPLPPVLGDAPRLVQVLVNLLANASKFSPEATPITLGGRAAPREVALWVEDRGPGLPAGPAEMLFQPFVRSPGEEPEASGVGLGLWVVQSIVRRHGGRVETTDTGHGARFTVWLPRAEPQRTGASELGSRG